MNFLPERTVENATLQSHRKSRARWLGMKLCVLVMILNSVAAVTEYAFGNKILAGAKVLIFSGAALSLALTRRKGPEGEFQLLPLYLAYWIGGNFNMAVDGGVENPFIVIFMATLYLAGVLLQTRFSRGKVVVLSVATVLMWALLSGSGVLSGIEWASSASQPPKEALVCLLRLVIGFTAFFVMMEHLFRSEEAFAAEREKEATLRRNALAQIAHAEKLAQVGKLVATTAHEFAQPVQVIAMCSSMLRRGLSAPAPLDPVKQANLKHFAENINDASFRLARLLNQLREFSRKDQFVPHPFDCCEVFQSIETMVKHDFEHRNIRFRMQKPDGPVTVSGDEMNVQQILFNLLSNGRDAALRGLSPMVEVSLERFREWARIRVVNSGPGIPLHEQNKLFEAYFTTKKRGEGTGLGLPVCQDLVALNKGRIFFCTDQDRTEFVVDLPLVT